METQIEEILQMSAECIQPDEFRNLIAKKPMPICYDGFEPSGRMHIAQGIYKTIWVNKLTNLGCHFKIWVADWFAKLNNKMGGDLKKIRVVGEYMIEIWKVCGMNMDHVEFVWASEEINRNPDTYWSTVMDISTTFNLNRIKRCCTIMGRQETDEAPASQIFYPCMQCADIFFLKADIAQLGMDQRKVNMLAREYCDAKKIKFKPVILSQHMIMGLLEGQEKMSKSNPDSAIFMEDSEADVKRKIKRAYCVMGEVESNPCMNYMQHIVFGVYDKVTLFRDGGDQEDKEYNSYQEFEQDWISQEIHAKDLKKTLTHYLNLLLEPVRKHFVENDKAKALLNRVKQYKITK